MQLEWRGKHIVVVLGVKENAGNEDDLGQMWGQQGTLCFS